MSKNVSGREDRINSTIILSFFFYFTQHITSYLYIYIFLSLFVLFHQSVWKLFAHDSSVGNVWNIVQAPAMSARHY